ncbi:hypothetical protein WISP_53132 [Willisornis vidua]|uniref:Uncharacterized protein n=1 Tax=Willisornis vidua TaxID=1566151 RepID=A0ABQ9DCY5_9PASS|nr:hypothetical protein WISP_53132 [Willisornis vidua]
MGTDTVLMPETHGDSVGKVGKNVPCKANADPAPKGSAINEQEKHQTLVSEVWENQPLLLESEEALGSSTQGQAATGDAATEATEMMNGLEIVSYEDRLQELGLVSLEKTERGSHEYIEVSRGRCQEDAFSNRTRSNGHKLKHKFHLNMRKNIFP